MLAMPQEWLPIQFSPWHDIHTKHKQPIGYIFSVITKELVFQERDTS